jgi:methyl-accepting chemotaxis protein-1 (serine sensor receptor)
MFGNLTIKTRLIFVIGFLAVQLIVGALIGIISLGFANDTTKTIYDDRLVAMGQLDKVVRLLNINQLALAKAVSGDPATLNQQMDEVEANIQTVAKVWGEYMATDLTPEEKKLAAQFVRDSKNFVAEGLKPAIASLRAQDIKASTDQVHGPMTQLFLPVREGINAMIQLQLDVGKSDFEQSQRTYQLVRASCIAGVLFGLFLAALVGRWLIRAISRPLEAAVTIAGGIAAGDLTQRIEVRSKDETGRLMQALKDMNDSLLGIVVQVRSGTDTIATASGQIAAGNLDLSSRTEEQASSLEETASSMEELTSTVRQNADNARHANILAVSASEVALKGGAVVAQVVETMASINDSSKKIVDIISVIDGIAFQTNILALNAAVEAARAGEQGRGFAVVATEVRNLAQRSAAAAKEIKTLIGNSVDQVAVGSKLVLDAGSTMDEVVASVRRVTDIMGEITAASEEQSAGIEQVNQAIAQMDQVTQQNAALVEQAAAAAESLLDQAGNLSQVVGLFQIDGMHAAALVTPALAASRKTPASPIAASARNTARAAPTRVVLAASTPSRNATVVTAAGSSEWEEF